MTETGGGKRGGGCAMLLSLVVVAFGCGDDVGDGADASLDASRRDSAGATEDGSVGDAAVGVCARLACDAPARCEPDEARCVCPDGYRDVEGDGSRCVDRDECVGDVHDCDSAATCVNTDGGFECDCPQGYGGDGHGDDGCTDIDECAEPSANDCLSEEECTNVPGSYACSCDLRGTFAALVALEVESDAVTFGAAVVANAMSATLKTFELRRVIAQDEGGIQVEVTPCGGTSAELCSPSSAFNEAWSQDFPRGLWSKLGSAGGAIELDGQRVGDPFITSDAAVFLGVSLPAAYASPPWPWPSAHGHADLTWLDPDEDSAPGATSIVRHAFRNDLWMSDSRFTQQDFDAVPASSPICGSGYGYWVHPDGSTRIREFHTGSRSVSRFVGEITSCDVIEGALRGPGPNNTPTADARIVGCVRSDGMACSGTQVSAYDAVPNPNRVNAGCFQQVRVPDSFTCADVLSYGFTLLGGPNADQCP